MPEGGHLERVDAELAEGEPAEEEAVFAKGEGDPGGASGAWVGVRGHGMTLTASEAPWQGRPPQRVAVIFLR